MSPDVLILGAGLAGCSLAWHLAPHARVMLLDPAPAPGAGASAENAGMVRTLCHEPYERVLSLRTQRFLEAPGDDWEGLAPSRRTGAVLGLGFDAAHLHDAVAALRAAGEPVEALSQVDEVAPVLKGSPLRAAWFLPGARVADAHALITGFVRGARRHGATVRCGTPALRLLQEGGRCVGVETPDGPVYAGRVVLAAGAWSAGLAETAGLRRPLIPLRRTLAQTAPHLQAIPDHPWAWIDDIGIYVRPEGGGWLGSPCDEAVSRVGPGEPSRAPMSPEAAALMGEKLQRWFPTLGALPLRTGWTGLRTFAPDRRPLLGADPELAGLWWAAGLGGAGVTTSYAVGEVLSAWIRGEATPWLRPRGVDPGRPFLRRWPIHPEGGLRSRLIDAG